MNAAQLAHVIAVKGRHCDVLRWSPEQLLTYAAKVADSTMVTRADVLSAIWDGLLAGFKFWQIRQSFEVDAEHGYEPGASLENAMLLQRCEAGQRTCANLAAAALRMGVLPGKEMKGG